MNFSSIAINAFYCFTGFLPGKITDCPDPTDVTDASCDGGVAAVAAVMRHSKERGDGPGFYYPQVVTHSQLVQLHPKGLDLNRLILHDRFGWNGFVDASTWVEDDRLDSSALFTPSFGPIMTNLVLEPTSKWAEFLRHVYLDEETSTAFVALYGEDQPGLRPAVRSMVAALDYIAYLNGQAGCFLLGNNDDAEEGDDEMTPTTTMSNQRCWFPVVHFADFAQEKLGSACLQAALEHPHPPILFYTRGTQIHPEINNNRTVVVAFDANGKKLSHLRIEIDSTDSSIKNVTLDTIDVNSELPLELKDEEYIEDRKFLRTLAEEAVAHDPVVGASGFMPPTRSDDDAKWRKCMGGECPIGNLFTDSLRWSEDDADFAVLHSGGLRGGGWPAGEVRVSDIWGALPFINYKCSGVMSGVSVFKLLNFSTAVATFESTYTKMGDRLLQMSGMRMTYNTLVSGTGRGRLMSVDVWDRQREVYLPLERLRLYKFVTDNWMCDHFDPFPSLFGSELQMEGEIPGSVDEGAAVQSMVEAYLTHLNGTYDTSIRGSHINDTEALEPMDFIQTVDSCLLDYFWEIGTLTCKPCPGGKRVRFSDDLLSFLATPDKKQFDGRNVLSNRELFNVTLAPKSAPEWVVFQNSTNNLMKGSTVLQPGENIAIDFGIDTSALGKGTTRSTISFGVVIDGEYPGCLTDLDITFDTLVEVRSEENLNQLGAVRPIGLTLMSLAIGMAILFALWTYKHRLRRVVRASQPTFMWLICCGTTIMAFTILPLSIDDKIASQDACSKACVAVPWLFSMGFSITFSALFAKIWRIHRVITNAERLKRVVVPEREAMVPIVVVFTLNFVLLLCWTLIDPPKWQREFINDDPTNSYGFCKSEGKASIAFLTMLSLLNFSALVLACVQAYRARKLDAEYSESRWLGIACLSWIQVLMVGVPVILLTQDQPVASYFTRTILVFLVCVSMLLFMFVPKIKLLSDPQRTSTRQQASRAPVSDSSKEVEAALKKRIIFLEDELRKRTDVTTTTNVTATTTDARSTIHEQDEGNESKFEEEKEPEAVDANEDQVL